MALNVRFITAGSQRSRHRPGGTRTPNRRFWRPVLYQLSYGPLNSLLGLSAEPSPGLSAGSHGQGQNRTADTMIFSHVLYQLSYLADKKTRPSL